MTRIPTAHPEVTCVGPGLIDSAKRPRLDAMACRGSLLVLLARAGLGYRPTDLNVQPSTDRRKGLIPARSDRAAPEEEPDDSLRPAVRT